MVVETCLDETLNFAYFIGCNKASEIVVLKDAGFTFSDSSVSSDPLKNNPNLDPSNVAWQYDGVETGG